MNGTIRSTAITLGLAIAAVAPVAAQTESQPAVAAHAPARGEGAVPESAELATPLKVGAKMPDVATLKTAIGETTSLAALLDGKPAVIIFYRGGWCPYCMTHLAELAKIEPELDKNGVRIVGISPDTPDKLAKTISDRNLTYVLLSDSDHAAMKAFGVAFTVDDPTNKKLEGYGIHLAEWSGSDDRILPVPSVFVVDASSKVTFAHSNPDYKVRLSGDEVLAAAGISKPAEAAPPAPAP